MTHPKDLKPIPIEDLKKSEGVLPLQNGTNKWASQRGMTGFGRPRDVLNQSKWKQEW